MKVKNNCMGKEWLGRQNNIKCRNENDMILGELSLNKLCYKGMLQVMNRESELKHLFSSVNV